jgi:hypothetical protein
VIVATPSTTTPASRPSSPRGAWTVVVVAYVGIAAVVATVWPLSSYALSLAAFGLAHVLTELRYVDARFGASLPRSFWRATAMILGLVIALRILGLAGGIAPAMMAPAELCLAALLFAVAVVPAWQRAASPAARALAVVGLVVAVAVTIGAVVDPVATLLVFALLHNATPALFLIERAPPERRGRTALASAAVFIGVPALVAAGAGHALLATRGLGDVAPWTSVGALADHYRAYLPASLHDDDAASRLFSAAVTAQLLHYGAVIVWLPATLTDDDRASLPWPRSRKFAGIVVALSLGLLLHFVADFAGARAAYGVAAAVHAWIEWPVLVVGLAGARPSPGSTIQQA